MENGFEKRAPLKKKILFEKFLIPPLKSFFKKKKNSRLFEWTDHLVHSSGSPTKTKKILPKNLLCLPKKRKFYLTNFIYLTEKISFSGSKKNVLSFLETISYISLKNWFFDMKMISYNCLKNTFPNKEIFKLALKTNLLVYY